MRPLFSLDEEQVVELIPIKERNRMRAIVTSLLSVRVY